MKQDLTPRISTLAGPENYCYWNGEERYEPPRDTGHVFRDKVAFARQIMKDYPNGRDLDLQGWPTKVGLACAIGQDGFGWIHLDALQRFWTRFPHIGGIWFGENVELGSHVTIDRGAIGSTIIGSGVKIDNGVHVGHNAVIRDHTLVTAHAVIGGSAHIGRDCWIGLGAIIREHITVGNGATIGMGAVVVKDVPAGETWVGNPARKLR
jgi:UDP-3-O-[3-hydroxymyristoyl] glucosamine N-acyltransferase